MEHNQDIVYDCVRELVYTDVQFKKGVTTEVIAKKTQLQRTNVSAILNKLVREDRLRKIKTRPVRYLLANSPTTTDAFKSLIGSNGSLKKAIQLAKAAVLYPSGSLNIQIIAQPGSGTSAFYERIVQFAEANQALKKDAPHVIVNCRNYASDIHALDSILFGKAGDFKASCFEQAHDGILFINHYEYLDTHQQARIIDLLDRKTESFDPLKTDNSGTKAPFIIFSCSTQGNQQLSQKLPVTISLPALEERPLSEKLELIDHMLLGEAKTSNRRVIVSTEVAKALLLSDYFHNVKEVLETVVMACANAYVRVVNEPGREINVYLDDLKPMTRRALLKEKENETVLSTLFGDSEKRIFDPKVTEQTTSNPDQISDDLYKDINKQYAYLVEQGVGSTNIKNVINKHIQKLFEKYSYFDHIETGNSTQQLTKIVKPVIVKIVRQWLDACQRILDRNFESSVFYGLCLHINSLLTIKVTRKRMSSVQARKLIEQYPQEYKESVKLAQILHDDLDLDLPTEETVLIMMFLVTPEADTANGHPVLLYVMHGNGTAKSLMETTNAMNRNHLSYAYDMKLDVSAKIAMSEIRATIQKIDQGQGVIVIYDMGSIKVMLDTISEETNIKIRPIQLPVTLIGIDAARKSSMETDIDYVYHLVIQDIRHMGKGGQQKEEMIITLCHTGEGGAAQLKDYIEQNSRLGMRVKALAMSDRQKLVDEVGSLSKIYQIHAFVGTYDPKLFGIPFIPIDKVFENSRDDLDQILTFKPVTAQHFAYERIYAYFHEQFKYTSVSKLKQLMPGIMDRLVVTYDLSEDQRVGLFVHLGSLVERTLEGVPEGPETQAFELNTRFPEDYKMLRKTLRPLERGFKIIITDDEIATILMIVKQL